MTTENQTTDDTADRLAESQHAQIMAEAELKALRPAALKQTIREAGFDPDSSAGRVLGELATTDSTLRTSTQALRAKAAELGLTVDPDQAAGAGPGPSALTFPNLPPDDPRNVPGTVANRLAAAQKSRHEKNQVLFGRMDSADAVAAPTPPATLPANIAQLIAEATADGDHKLARHLKNQVLQAKMMTGQTSH